MIAPVYDAAVADTPFVAPPGQDESLDRMADAANYNSWLFRRARPFLGRRVLDFGAGVGTFTELIAEDADVVALEPDPAFLPRLRERFHGRENVEVVHGTDERIASLGRFDSVVCLNVLEHIRDDDVVLARLGAALVEGGHVLLLVPAHQALFGGIDRSVGHERRYGRELLRGRLEQARLAPIELRYVNPVGALGWLVSSRLLGREQVPTGPLRLYDSLVPLLRSLDRIRLPFGLSLWAVARKTSA
jgi:SAM-dependent methyltransferase